MQVFTRLEEQIVRTLAAHITRNDEVSLTELALECHVAKSTVVKAVQKLGYHGFGDLSRSVRLNARAGDGTLLPRVTVEGDARLAVRRLSACLRRCEGRRNFIFSGDRRTGRLLATYMSRKLAMFDILAPASYDYDLARRETLPCGIAFFCTHQELPGRLVMGQQEGYGEGMMHAARSAGFSIVAFSDDERRRWEPDDTVISIAPSPDGREDRYMPKVLMTFEQALAAYAAERGHGGEA